MSYSISLLHEGQIILVTEAHRCNPLDWIIQWSEDSPFNHAALVVRDAHGDLCLAEALWRIQYAPLDKYQQNGWVFPVAGWMPDKSAAISQFVTAHLGQRYGWQELLADGARLDLHLPFWAHWHPHHWTCSQFVADAFQSVGLTLSYAPLVTPANLADSPLLIGPRP